jgi:hypothetical protein
MAAVTSRPGQVIGLHFFNPAHIMKLVEIVRGDLTSAESLATCRAFVEGLGKTAVVCKDTPAFIVNRVARPFYGEAFRLLGENAADVGVVVEFPNGTVYTQCVEISDGESAYRLLRETELDIDWSGKGAWGRALCMINGVGDDVVGDGCDWGSDYWGFYLALDNGTSWDYSPVGFDMGDCWNREFDSFSGHYCAQDGDMVGFAYGGFGTKPDFRKFTQVCRNPKEDGNPHLVKKRILMSSRPFWKNYAAECGIEYTDRLPAQNLVRRCKQKLAKEPVNRTLELEDTEVETEEKKPIFYDYSPKKIESIGDPFTVSLSSLGGELLPNLTVFVNGFVYTTDDSGSFSFPSARGDHIITASPEGFEELRVTFRMG